MISDEDMKIFQKAEGLEKAYKEAKKAWIKEVQSGRLKYVDTKPTFDNYVALHKEWQDFFFKNGAVLLAKRQ